MSHFEAGAALLAMATGVAGFALWVVLLLATLKNHRHPDPLAMALVGTLAALGALSSALAFGPVFGFHLPGEALTFLASMGRGALLAGGIILLARQRWL